MHLSHFLEGPSNHAGADRLSEEVDQPARVAQRTAANPVVAAENAAEPVAAAENVAVQDPVVAAEEEQVPDEPVAGAANAVAGAADDEDEDEDAYREWASAEIRSLRRELQLAFERYGEESKQHGLLQIEFEAAEVARGHAEELIRRLQEQLAASDKRVAGKHYPCPGLFIV